MPKHHETHVHAETAYQGDNQVTRTTAHCDDCEWWAEGLDEADVRDEAAAHTREKGDFRIQKLEDLYDAVTSIQADTDLLPLFSARAQGELNRVANNAERLKTNLEEDDDG